MNQIISFKALSTSLIASRGLKKIAYGRYLSISRFRRRLGLPSAPNATGPLCDEPDWSYPDGTPGQMNKGQTNRYIRDQEFAETMVTFAKQFKEIEKMRQNRKNQAEISDQK